MEGKKKISVTGVSDEWGLLKECESMKEIPFLRIVNCLLRHI